MSKTKQKLLIIDGNALIHRSFHALPPTMTTKSGEMVNAVYGFTTFLIKAIREFKPSYIALTLDKKGPTFRHKEYADYKAKRVKAPDDLYKQIPRIKELARVLSIPIYEMEGFEADDLIGTIATETDGNIEKIIVTGDLDTLQLVNEHTKVYTMSRGLSDSIIYDIKAVKTRYALGPEQMIDFKALRGDPSDNIPGVPGIGEKTAVELLKKFKTLDGVYDCLTHNAKRLEQKVRPRIIELLKKHKKDAYNSKKLVTIKCNVRIKFKLEDACFGNFNKEEVVKFLSELEFKSLLPRIKELGIRNLELGKDKDKSGEIDKFERNKKRFKYVLVDNEKKFKTFLTKLKKQSRVLGITFDTETSSFDPLTAELLGISFSWKEGEAYYVATTNSKQRTANPSVLLRAGNKQNLFNYKSNSQFPIPNSQLQRLKPIFENEKIKKYGHNIKFDVRVMKNQGIDVKGAGFDTMIASYLLNPGTRQHNLDALTFSELGFEKISKDDLLGSAFAKATADKTGKKVLKKQIGFSEVETEKLSLYSCEDADFTNRLVNKLKPQLKKQKLDSLFNKIEIPLIKVLGQMENNGIMIDKNFLLKMSKKISKKIKILEGKIYKQASVKFNINSTQQLRKILYEKLEIPTDNISKTKTGLSTAADELVKLRDLHPIIPLLQEYRELKKLITTYVDALPDLVNKKTGRLHTSFNQAVTATGRLSSTEPNLQNIPIRTELGREIRQAFVVQKGYKLLSLDYSQIELRLAAHMSGDKKMIKAFRAGADIHQMTAAEINQVLPEEVTREMRRQAKAINFGILYGQGPHGLAQSADIPYWRAKEFIEEYFKAYKDVKKFVEKSVELAKKNSYAETLFNRRRYLPEINSSVVQVRKAAERMAINMPLQGTAADMIKVAMINVSRMLHEFKANTRESNAKGGSASKLEAEPPIQMLLQVHDELLFEVKTSEVKKFAQKIKDIMENVIKLKVPVVVDVKAGENWGEMELISN